MSKTEQPPAGEAPRRHDRRPLALLVQYRASVLEDFTAEYIVNLAPGGLFVRTDAPHPKGTLLTLQFPLKDGTRLIEGTGLVVHVVSPAEGTPERPAGMGIAFEQLDDDSRALVLELWDRRASRPRP